MGKFKDIDIEIRQGGYVMDEGTYFMDEITMLRNMLKTATAKNKVQELEIARLEAELREFNVLAVALTNEVTGTPI